MPDDSALEFAEGVNGRWREELLDAPEHDRDLVHALLALACLPDHAKPAPLAVFTPWRRTQ